MARANYDVDVLSYGTPSGFFEHNKDINRYVTIATLNKFSKLRALLLAFRLIKENNYVVVNFHMPDVFAAFLTFVLESKVMYTFWGSDILIGYKQMKGIRRHLFNIALNKCWIMTADSQSVFDVIRENLPNLPNDRMKIIRWGINTKIFRLPADSEKNYLKKQYCVEDHIVMLSVRLLRPKYQILELIRQFNRAFSDDADFVLFIRVPEISDPEYVALCKRESRNNRKILFHESPLDHSRLAEIYKIADVSLHFPISDATPVSMLESAASGNLIICEETIKSYMELGAILELDRMSLKCLNPQNVKSLLEKSHEKRERVSGTIAESFSEEVSISNLGALSWAR